MFPYALTNQEKPAEPLYQYKNTTTLYPSASSLATIAALITIHALQAIRESEKVNDEHKRLQYHPPKRAPRLWTATRSATTLQNTFTEVEFGY